MPTGRLTAKREGPHIRFEMDHHPDYTHAFMVEKYLDTREELDALGNLVPVEVWEPIHTGTAKFVKHGHTHETARTPDDPDASPQPLPGGRYRALGYRLAETSVSGVEILHTDGVYTDVVTV